MSLPYDMDAIKALPADERVELAYAILDSVEEEQTDEPLTDAMKAFLEQRLEAYRKNPERVTPWEVVRDRVAAKYRK